MLVIRNPSFTLLKRTYNYGKLIFFRDEITFGIKGLPGKLSIGRAIKFK